jgi:hypothetical protein
MFLSACFFPYQNEKSRASIVPNWLVAAGAGICASADVIRTGL